MYKRQIVPTRLSVNYIILSNLSEECFQSCKIHKLARNAKHSTIIQELHKMTNSGHISKPKYGIFQVVSQIAREGKFRKFESPPK